VREGPAGDLIVGGALFAGVMRRLSFTTLINPFELRFGKRWAAVLFLPALAGEPLLGLPAIIHYPDGVPFRTLAAVTGLVLLPLVSRATARWDASRPLEKDVALAAEA
jgi:hypothetical protein